VVVLVLVLVLVVVVVLVVVLVLVLTARRRKLVLPLLQQLPRQLLQRTSQQCSADALWDRRVQLRALRD
jgi:hypothetical protein